MSHVSSPDPDDPWLAEIGRQAASIRGAAVATAGRTVELRTVARRRADERLVVTGMGSSFHAAHAIVTSLAETGMPAHLVSASELLHFGMSTLDSRSTLLVVSQSGRSVEVVRLLERLGERPDHPFVVAITNGRGNPLAAAADVAFDTAVGPELGPATMTFGASLVVLDALARVLAGGATADISALCAQVATDAEETAVAIDHLLADRPALTATMLAWLDSRRNIVILGRGAGRAAADMASLTIKEVAGVAAESMLTADFRHGPLELVGEDLAVAFVAIEPATAAIDLGFATELTEGPSSVLVVGPGPAAGGAMRIVGVDPVERRMSPAVAVVPFQLLARELAIGRGRRPGVFGSASKITTRE